MKNLLVLSLILLSVGCERARMSKTGTPPEQRTSQNEKPAHQNTFPVTSAAPNTSAAPGDTPSQAVNDKAPPHAPATAASGAQEQAGDVTRENRTSDRSTDDPPLFDGSDANSTPICQGADCKIPVIRDDGRYSTEQELRFEPRTRELAILFIFDTSLSMRDEHQAVAHEINKFISELSPDVKYRIGVMLAHGPRTKANVKVGSLYSPNQKDLVISSQELEKKFGKEQVASKITEILTERLTNLPIDRSEAQGEVGLLNLYTAFSNPTKLHELKQAGLLNNNSALLVVTVADENDICFDYEEASRERGYEVVGTYAQESDRVNELRAFQAQDTCRSVAKGQRLTARHAVEAVQNAQGNLPVIFTGIHYLEGKVPEKTDKFSKDNEPGRGYLDVIEIGKGIAIDMASDDFAKALTKIGNFSNFHMKWENTFLIPGKVDLKRFDPQSIRVRIRSANGQEHEIDNSEIRHRLENQRVSIIINYKALEHAYQQKWITEGAQLLIDYGYKD